MKIEGAFPPVTLKDVVWSVSRLTVLGLTFKASLMTKIVACAV